MALASLYIYLHGSYRFCPCRIFPKYFELVIELISSFPLLLSKILKSNDPSTALQDPTPKWTQLQILEEILVLDVDLRRLVDRLIRHKRAYKYLQEFEYKQFDQYSAVADFYTEVYNLKFKLIDALHLAKSLTRPAADREPELLDVEDLVVYASRLSKITSAVEGLKSLEAPLPQEHHARASILSNGINTDSESLRESKKPQIPEGSAGVNLQHYQAYPDYPAKRENSSVHSEEDRDKWLNLEL